MLDEQTDPKICFKMIFYNFHKFKIQKTKMNQFLDEFDFESIPTKNYMDLDHE